MKSKKFLSTMLAVAICILAFAGCNKQQEGALQGESSNSSQSGTQTEYSDAKQIVLSDDGITVDGKTVAAADLLVPGIGELIGGSQREERLDVLLDSMKKFGLKEEDYWWYINLRRYGGTKHAGFGLGFERMVMYLTGISNIRDVLPFPRTVSSCEY